MTYLLSLVFLLHFQPAVQAQSPPLLPKADSFKGQGWLGVTLKLDNQSRILIDSVGNNTPADKAGLKAGDIITKINKTPFSDLQSFIKKIKSLSPGTQITLSCISKGKSKSVPLLLGLRPESSQIVSQMYLNKEAPPIDIVDTKSKEKIDIANYRGKVVLLDFWATWCGPCRYAMPHLSRLSEKYESKGLKVIGVSSEDRSTIRRFIAKNPLPYQIANYAEGENPQKYFVTALPTAYLIDRQGNIASIVVGGGERNLIRIEKQILKLLQK